jgi:hypothetical protein
MKKRKNKNNRKNKNGYKIPNTNSYTERGSVNMTFIEPHRYVTLKYCQTNIRTDLTTVGSNQVFNCNSIVDPDRTGLGHQPYGFDVLQILYNRYRVLKFKYKIIFGASSMTYHVGVVPTNGNLNVPVTNGTTFENSCELPFSKSGIVCVNGIPKTIQGTVDLNKIGGVTRVEFLADDRYEATTTTSPAELVVLNCVSYNPNGATNTFQMQSVLEYEVDLHDPNTQPPSLYNKMNLPDVIDPKLLNLIINYNEKIKSDKKEKE